MKKIITCLHDKKADIFEGFTIHNNTSDALRSFEVACQQSESLKRWPEDYQLLFVGVITFENGEISKDGETKKKGLILDVFKNTMILAEAKDFFQKNEKQNEKID